MKQFLLMTAMLIGIFANAQEESDREETYRHYTDTTGNYLIHYSYSTGIVMIPAIDGPVQPHYSATITVYRLINITLLKKGITQKAVDTIMIGKPFPGTYVPDPGCFEDVPQNLVAVARHLQAEAKKD